MFGKKSNPQAMMEAQEQIEKAQNHLEQSLFSDVVDGVKVTLKGDKTLVNVECLDNPGSVSTPALMAAYKKVEKELRHKRSVTLVQVRNAIKKQYRVDIKSMIPEIAEAVSYMDSVQKSA